MLGKRTIIIIPPKIDTENPVYRLESAKYNHLEMYEAFSLEHFKKLIKSKELILEGYIIMEAYQDDYISTLLAYVPNHITENQYTILVCLKEFIEQFELFDALIVNENENIYVFDTNMEDDIAKRNDIFYKKMKECTNTDKERGH